MPADYPSVIELSHGAGGSTDRHHERTSLRPSIIYGQNQTPPMAEPALVLSNERIRTRKYFVAGNISNSNGFWLQLCMCEEIETELFRVGFNFLEFNKCILNKSVEVQLLQYCFLSLFHFLPGGFRLIMNSLTDLFQKRKEMNRNQVIPFRRKEV